MRFHDGKHLGYAGYAMKFEAAPDRAITQTTRGTPGGEYLRRFWLPVLYEYELGEFRKRIRILGEDLEVFRDRARRTGEAYLKQPPLTGPVTAAAAG